MNIIYPRELRIFISSTFEDLKDERKYLMTRVFPKLKQKAIERGVELLPIDLRWGISSDEISREKFSGKIIDTCLNEIDKAHCFIGIVGNRYGWCPQPKELKRSRLLKESHSNLIDSGMSITEIEMQYGVFQSKKKRSSFFFIKDNDDNMVLDKHNIELRNTIYHETDERKYKVFSYSSLNDFAEQVETSINEVLNSLFPEKNLPPYLLRLFEQNLILNKLLENYIPRRELFKKIDEGFKTSQFVLITGDFGMGKSALIANWITSQGDNKNGKVFYYFIDSKDKNDPQSILRFFCYRISESYGIPLDEQLFDHSPLNLLYQLCSDIGSHNKLILAIDGISDEQILMSQWLPNLPDNIRILFSTWMIDDNRNWASNNKYPIITVEDLNQKDKSKFIKNYLKRYSKELDKGLIDKLSQRLPGGILTLRILLDIIIVFGDQEILEDLIRTLTLNHPVYKKLFDELHGLTIEDLGELISEEIHDEINFGRPQSLLNRFYSAILQIYETSYPEIPFSEFVAAIVFNYPGIKEDEIVNFVRTTPIVFANFKYIFGSYLKLTNGFIGINNEDLRNAAMKRYDRLQEDVYLRAKHFFDEDDGTTRSQTAHLAYSRCEDDIDMLLSSLFKPCIFHSMYHDSPIALSRYWDDAIAEVPEQEKLMEFARYMSPDGLGGYFLTESIDEEIDILQDLARFSIDYMCNSNVALFAANHAYSLLGYNEGKKHLQKLEIGKTIVEAFILLGAPHKAIKLVNSIVENYKKTRDIIGLADSYRLQGELLLQQSCYNESLNIIHISKSIYCDNMRKENLGYILCLLSEGRTLMYLEEYSNALKIFSEALISCQNLFGHNNLHYAQILFELATCNIFKGDLDQATTELVDSRRILRFLLHDNNPHFAKELYLEGKILLQRGRPNIAKCAFIDAIMILESHNITDQLYLDISSQISMINKRLV